MHELLLVVDMQNGFVFSKTEHIIDNILTLINSFKENNKPVVFTRFINKPDSGYVKWIKWSRFMEEPEIDIIPVLRRHATKVIDKYGYTAFTSDFKMYLEENSICKVYICGVATDGCVLKTAVDCFENNVEPIVIKDACASHAGLNIHQKGLLLISRFIGKQQLVNTADVLTMY